MRTYLLSTSQLILALKLEKCDLDDVEEASEYGYGDRKNRFPATM